jgi:hypothetical protein
MSLGQLLECSFLIPFKRDSSLSDGQLHGRKTWEWLQAELFVRFDGFTRAPGKFSGAYVDPDTKQQVSDESRKYIVAVADSQIDELRKLLSAACVLFQQKCIYLNIAGKVEFIEPPPYDSNQSIP